LIVSVQKPSIESVRSEIHPVKDGYVHNTKGGAYNPVDSLGYAESMRFDTVARLIPHPVKVECCFAWDWNRGGTMDAHVDREGLDWTLTMPMDDESARWPIHVEGLGEIKVKAGEGLLFEGRKYNHWRKPCPTENSTWLMYHYREVMADDIRIRRNLLNGDEIETLLNEDVEWHPATTTNNTGVSYDNRKSEVCWLYDMEKWQWLYDRIDGWMRSINSMLLEDQPEQLQLTRNNEGEYFGWHPDHSEYTPRTLSATVALQNAGFGGAFEIRDCPNLFLKAGDAVAFSSHLYHRVAPVEKGVRYSLVRWMK